MSLEFFVPGVARPKGSMKAFKSKAMRFASMTNSSEKTKPWQATVALAAREAGAKLIDGPVYVGVTVFFSRPKGHFGTGKKAGILKASAPILPISHKLGDADKHARVVLDALTGVCFADDSQVTSLMVDKFYMEGDDQPGAHVRVRSMGTGKGLVHRDVKPQNVIVEDARPEAHLECDLQGCREPWVGQGAPILGLNSPVPNLCRKHLDEDKLAPSVYAVTLDPCPGCERTMVMPTPGGFCTPLCEEAHAIPKKKKREKRPMQPGGEPMPW